MSGIARGRWWIATAALLWLGLPSAGTSLSQRESPARQHDLDTLTVPAGEVLLLELETPLHTRVTREGDTAEFITPRPMRLDNRIVIPRDTLVRATVTFAKRPGRLKGRGELRLRFDELVLPDGTCMPFSAFLLRAGFIESDEEGAVEEPKLEGDSSVVQDTVAVVQSGAEGALLGAVVGGKKGAGVGGAIGAGLAVLGTLLRRGPDLDLPRGTRFEVRLESELRIPLETLHAALPSPADSGAGAKDPEQPEYRRARPAWEAVPEPPASGSEPPVRELPAIPPPPEPEGPEAGYTVRVAVRTVLLDAVVRDATGRALEELRAEDFRVFEDGVEQEISLFSRDELPMALALVVDASSSVAPYMRELRTAAREALERLKEGDEVALFSFDSQSELLQELTADRQQVADRIERIRAGGNTNVVDALFDAMSYLEEAAPGRRHVVLLVSDNQHTAHAEHHEDELLRLAIDSETTLFSLRTRGDHTPSALRFPSIIGTRVLRALVRETGGEIVDVERPGQLAGVLDALVVQLKLRYTLGYVSTNRSLSGKFREVEIQLSDRFGEPGRSYTTQHRRGYYALPPASEVSSPSGN